MANEDVTKMLSDCESLKPKDLILDSLKWKYLVRSVLRGKNILFIGPSREGKTKAAISVANALGRKDKFFIFNLGSTQDARATLIGNMYYSKEKGTFLDVSQFAKAIQIPGAVILLDELSRGHHDAWNLLMPVLCSTQRTLRLDESKGSEVIHVAEGVTFIATANIGNEYTATRVMDAALTFRFPVIVEMEPLDYKGMSTLITVLHPEANQDQLENMLKLCHISNDSKVQVRMDNPKITKFVPTGVIVEAAELVIDGFTLKEIAEMVVYPMYDDSGGADSERLFAKQLVQKHLDAVAAAVPSPIHSPSAPKSDSNGGKKVNIKF